MLHKYRSLALFALFVVLSTAAQPWITSENDLLSSRKSVCDISQIIIVPSDGTSTGLQSYSLTTVKAYTDIINVDVLFAGF